MSNSNIDTESAAKSDSTDEQTNTNTSTHPATREEYVERADGYDRAPEGFEADWTEEDTKVPDHPVVVKVDGQGEAAAHLVAWAVVEDLQDGDGTFGADQVAQIIREHYVSPSFEGIDGTDVRQMKMAVPDRLLDAIMPGMQTQMQSDGSAQVDSDAGNR